MAHVHGFFSSQRLIKINKKKAQGLSQHHIG